MPELCACKHFFLPDLHVSVVAALLKSSLCFSALLVAKNCEHAVLSLPEQARFKALDNCETCSKKRLLVLKKDHIPKPHKLLEGQDLNEKRAHHIVKVLSRCNV